MNTRQRKPKRPWAKSTRPYSVRLSSDEARTLNGLVRKLRLSQSRVFATALGHYAKHLTNAE